MIKSFRCLLRRASWGTLGVVGFIGSLSAQDKTTFTDPVLPLVEQQCAKCHNPDTKKGDLDLTSHSGVLKGGGTGPVVVPGNFDASKLIKALTHAEEPFMPPNKPPLAEKELAVFKKWITGGLLETSGSKAIAAARPSVDLTLKVSDNGKPAGPPPMPKELSIEPFTHTPRSDAIHGLAASPWAPLVAIAGQKQILLYNTTNLNLLGILPFTEGQPFEVKFSRSGKLLLAGGGHGAKSGKVVLWNVETGGRVTTVGNEYDSILTADLSPDQTKVALGGPDRLIKIHSTKTGELQHKIKKHTDWVTAVAFSPNGAMLATADRNGGVTVWDADNGQELFTTPGHKAGVTALSWRVDSRVLASSSEDGTIKLWESSEGRQAKTWNAHSGGALWVAYSRDGRLVSCGRDGAVISWNAEGNKLKSYPFSGEMALRCAWSDDLSRIIAADFTGAAAVWDSKDGGRLGTLETNPKPLAERIDAVRKRLAEIATRGDQPSPALAVAKAAFEKLTAETQTATLAAGRNKADFEAKAKEVVRLKELAARPNPAADVAPKLAAARATREKARAAKTAAADALEIATQRAAAAKVRIDRLNSQDPKAELAAAEADLQRLVAAQSLAVVSKLREAVLARQRDAAALQSAIEGKQEEIARLTTEARAAKDSTSKSSLKKALKAAQTEASAMSRQLKKASAEAALEQARLDELVREHELHKNGPTTDRAAAGGS
jgi:WD40 repeat protein